MLTKASCNSASFVFEPMFTLFPEILADTGDIYDGIETFGDYMRIIGKHHLMTLKDRPKTEPTPET